MPKGGVWLHVPKRAGAGAAPFKWESPSHSRPWPKMVTVQ